MIAVKNTCTTHSIDSVTHTRRSARTRMTFFLTFVRSSNSDLFAFFVFLFWHFCFNHRKVLRTVSFWVRRQNAVKLIVVYTIRFRNGRKIFQVHWTGLEITFFYFSAVTIRRETQTSDECFFTAPLKSITREVWFDWEISYDFKLKNKKQIKQKWRQSIELHLVRLKDGVNSVFSTLCVKSNENINVKETKSVWRMPT